jgi:acyl-CoA synthetase (AMP-forming)/AMP-acid ligase II
MGKQIWRSRIPPFEPVPAFVDEEALREATRRAHRPAVVEARTGRSVTFGQLLDGSRRVAAGLTELGVGRGDVVSIVAANHADYPVVLYGALGAGAAVASANPALTAGELERQLARSKPRVVFADAISRAAVEEALEAAGSEASLWALDDGVGGPSIGALLAPPGAPVAGREPSDLALLFPSSGTTGLPKIAAHTHANATAFFQAYTAAPGARFTPDDVVGLIVPFTHLYGAAMLSYSLHCGATVVSLAVAGFDFEAFMRMLQDHAVTVAPVTPPVVLALARHPLVDRFDLSSLRLLLTAAAPCPPEVQDEVEARLGCRVADLLGSTEAWCYSPAAEPPVRGSVGMVGANVEAMIVDAESGASLGPGQTGELWIRGPQMMRGYLDDAEATAAVLDGEGWLHTGDLCSIDEEGNIFVVDRLKELIKVGGYSVAPAEVERELIAHPAVADAAVVGRPDSELGEVPVAYVALVQPVERDDLLAWLQGRLAPWKHVRDVVVIERVPRNPTGKIVRRELIERERGERAPGHIANGVPATSRPSSVRRETPSFPNAVER